MNKPDITSGEQYGLLLSYELAKIDSGLPSELLDIWCDEVYATTSKLEKITFPL